MLEGPPRPPAAEGGTGRPLEATAPLQAWQTLTKSWLKRTAIYRYDISQAELWQSATSVYSTKIAQCDFSGSQLLINQVTGLKTKMENSDEASGAEGASTAAATASTEVNGGGGSSNGRAAYEDIASKAVGMTESIKHAIVLLQIAKVPSFSYSEGTVLD